MRLSLLLALLAFWAVMTFNTNWPEDVREFDYIGYFVKQYAELHN